MSPLEQMSQTLARHQPAKSVRQPGLEPKSQSRVGTIRDLLKHEVRPMSAAEIATSYTVGFIVSWLLGWYVLPIWGFEQSAQAATTVTIIYTVVSVIRAYIVRRVFNWVNA